MSDEMSLKRLLDFEAGFLAFLLASCIIENDGTVVETRQLVGKTRGLSIHVYPNEHAPPHFHVKRDGQDASFTLDDCTLLNGKLSNGDCRIIKYWHGLHRDRVIDAWNATRPSDCVVGRFTP